ncbi:4-hydroxythreonine-4-phosphate dehydrogenase [Stieleria bergensis]|uniref:4-hydroxythreonine-4-phosphate dehydrogenase n=1 Tax=Stieleria bergensis TaxID=2528025 RepID=A0A517SZ21_9BACT|nr:4-hydroxythreonine-4-phosphate dehydrogenase [Planctomycetes bacterium SV_7m_r]
MSHDSGSAHPGNENLGNENLGKPKLAITVGDAAGIGPELALQAAAAPQVLQIAQPLLVGPAAVLRRVAQQLDLPLPPVLDREMIAARKCPSESASIVSVGDLEATNVQPGSFSAATGWASFQAVDQSIAWARAGVIDGIVTGPIQKEAWHAAEAPFLGHTELLADRCGIDEYCMMLTGSECSTVLVTIHQPLVDAIASLSVASIERAIRLAGQAMQKRHQRSPRITVLGLNPHAGENGLISHGEEERLIQPAIDRVRAWSQQQGWQWQITDPVPPDTAFTPAMRRQTDVHVCMYHDQGLIPLKALSFDDGVNVTLGLPIVRTSVDHGTAMDLAWQGTASVTSMLSAISLAAELA